MSLGAAIVAKMRQRRRTPAAPLTGSFSEGDLARLVQRIDGASEVSRVNSEYIHVSSLLDFCPRKWRLAAMDKVELTNLPTSAQRVMWMIGRAAEHHVRGSIISALNGGGVHGNWDCRCGKSTRAGVYREETCNSCHEPLSVYREAAVVDSELMISGSPDLPIETADGMLICEIKSINKREFDTLTEPKANHVFQAACYHKLFAQQGVRMTDNVAVFYVCKDFSFSGSPYREFHVSAQDFYPVIEAAFNEVRSLRQSELRGDLPAKLPVCSSHHSPTAKKCPLSVHCFSR